MVTPRALSANRPRAFRGLSTPPAVSCLRLVRESAAAPFGAASLHPLARRDAPQPDTTTAPGPRVVARAPRCESRAGRLTGKGGGQGPVNALAFSENGYYLATWSGPARAAAPRRGHGVCAA